MRRWVAGVMLGLASGVWGQSSTSGVQHGRGAAPVAIAQSATRWVGSWGTAVQVPEPANALTTEALTDATLRQVVRLSCGGSVLRVHVSNAFGTRALRLTAVHVARPVDKTAGTVDAATDRVVTFGGETDVVIPPGAQMISDAVSFAAGARTDVAISLHLEEAPVVQTGHPGSRATSFVAKGDQTAAEELTEATKFQHWEVISGVDVAADAGAYAVVALGDSITDGHGATTDGNDRWTDVLAERMQAEGMRNVGVLNEGIGGNHLLTDGLGPNVLARLDRDVLAQAGVRYVIVLEGVNDLGSLSRDGVTDTARHAAMVRAIEGAYTQIVERAHAAGLKVVGATVMPYMGSDYYHPGAADEAARQQVNAWIREPGHFDAVVDFDAVMRDPKRAGWLLPAFDSGDHLHPGPEGYRAMGRAVALGMLG